MAISINDVIVEGDPTVPPDSSGGGGGGHTIINASGTDMPQRAGLQFEDANVSDDSANDVTKIKSTNFVGTITEWNMLSLSEKAQYRTVDLTDDFGGSPIDSTPTQNSSNAVSSGGVYTELGKAYRDTDSSETTIADDDYFPFYDTSATAKRKALWSTIINKIKSVFGSAAYLAADTENTADTVVKRDAYGNIKGTIFQMTNNMAAPTYWNTSSPVYQHDGYIMRSSKADYLSWLGLGSAAYLTADSSGTASTVVQRSGYGYINAGNSSTENPASYTAYPVFQDSDGWFRKSTKANYLEWLGFTATKKKYSTGVLQIGGSTYATHNVTLSGSNVANLGIVVGFAITSSPNVCMMQVYLASNTSLVIRVRNTANATDSYNVDVYYL